MKETFIFEIHIPSSNRNREEALVELTKRLKIKRSWKVVDNKRSDYSEEDIKCNS